MRKSWPALGLAGALIALSGCGPYPPQTLDEAASRLRIGMSEKEVEAAFAGGSPGESSSGTLGKPYYPFPVDIPTAKADSRSYYIGPTHGVVVCFLDDKLVAWALSPNRDPLLARAAKLRVGQTYEEAREIMGADQSNEYRWNGKWINRRMIYSEGSSSPATGVRSVIIDLQKEVVVSIRQGPNHRMPIGPGPWDDDYKPNYTGE